VSVTEGRFGLLANRPRPRLPIPARFTEDDPDEPPYFDADLVSYCYECGAEVCDSAGLDCGTCR
jgi:hypothetical protein